jgi:integrase
MIEVAVKVKVLKDKDIEALTKSVCLGDGLWVIVQKSKSGGFSRSFVFRYRSLDRTKRTRSGEVKREELWIGSTQKYNIDQAREIARRAQEWLTSIPPQDPILKWRKERANEITLGDGKKNRANVTVAEYIDLDYIPNVLDPGYPEYISHSGTGQKRLNTTRQKYVKALARLRDGVGPHHPSAVTGQMLRDDCGYGQLYLEQFSTSNTFYSMAITFFQRAKADGLCSSNPVDDLKVIRPRRPKKHKPKRKQGVFAEDMYEFLTLLDGHQDGRRRGLNSKPYRMDSVYACKMLGLTAVRVGEVVQMTWKEIHSDVRRYLAGAGDLPPIQNRKWNVHLESMKIQGDDDERPIPITSSVMDILQEMWSRNPHGDDDPVFRGQRGTRGFFYTANAINDGSRLPEYAYRFWRSQHRPMPELQRPNRDSTSP